MTTTGNRRSGGRVLADALKLHGVDTVFGVPGESYLAVIDALYDLRDDIRFIVCRQEGGAANMADAYGKLTGKPGIVFVTRGPGATNASVGVHTAFQDSTPMILFVGQVARGHSEREAFQEMDYRRMFGQMAKWVAQIEDPARIPEMVSRAFHTALAGRQGPVVLALPEDMLTEATDVGDARPHHVVQASPAAEDMAQLREMLAASKRPFMVVGGGGWTKAATEDIVAFAEANDLPTGVGFRCQDKFDNLHRNYAGDVAIAINPKLARRVKDADLLIAVGPRLGEIMTSGYTLLKVPVPDQRLVHVHPGAEELGRVYSADLPINAGMPRFARAARAMEPVVSSAWSSWSREARADYEEHLTPPPMAGALDMGAVMTYLRDILPADAILTNGGGNYSVWAHRFYQFREFPTQLGPTSGAMGYAVPSAVAAKAVRPDSPVICFAGDGEFLMTGQELATAVQYDLNIIVLVINNGMYGTIRMHQERDYPGRVHATDLRNPDFAAYARAFGAHGEVVERTEAFPAAFDRATQAGRPALLELRIDPEQITPRTTLSALRAASARG